MGPMQALRTAVTCQKAIHLEWRLERKAMRRAAAAAEQALRMAGPFGMESLQERARTLQAEPAKTAMAVVQMQAGGAQHFLPGLARSSLEVSMLAVPPCEDPAERWGLGKAPDRHDTVQTPARRPDRYAMRFPTGRVAGKAVALLAGHPCARLPVEVD